MTQCSNELDRTYKVECCDSEIRDGSEEYFEGQGARRAAFARYRDMKRQNGVAAVWMLKLSRDRTKWLKIRSCELNGGISPAKVSMDF